MRKRILLFSGILSSVLYISMNIFIPMLYAGYNSASQTVSELSAVGTPARALWIAFGVAYALLIIAFGWGMKQSAGHNKNLRAAGNLLLLYGMVSLFWPFAPMHQREVLAAGGKTMSDTMHLILAAVTVILMVAAIGFGAASLGKRFRIYSIITILMLLVFGILTAKDAPLVQANQPTPYAGIWERINIGVFMLWIIVLALILMKKGKALSGLLKN
ncbi:MAG TPA: DUF998 domain-containing protein [Chitinophagaceae bacterium]|nr:DUF998 domain-containing protein [Chitinophagaceae bacterium]